MPPQPRIGIAYHKNLRNTTTVENKDKKLEIIKTPMLSAVTKTEIDNAIRSEWKRKWQNAPHYKHTKYFYSKTDKNLARNILNISRSRLTRQISIITGFNCLSYIQFKANSSINPQCRLCGEDNETYPTIYNLTIIKNIMSNQYMN